MMPMILVLSFTVQILYSTGHNPSNSNWDVMWNLQMAEISSSSSLLFSRKNNKSYGVEWRSTAPDQIIEQKSYVRKKQGQIH
jgi:hypothetical protein